MGIAAGQMRKSIDFKPGKIKNAGIGLNEGRED